MKLLFFDLKTTGTNPGKNGIPQISGEIVIDGVTKEKFDFNVQPNPKALIEEQALSVAGGIREQTMAYTPMGEIYHKLVAMLGKYVKTGKFFLVGYNHASLDNQFLRGLFLQNNDQYFDSWFYSNSIDVMVLASNHLAHCRAEIENFKLSTVAKYLGIEVSEDNLHDAFYDIYLTKAIFDIVK